MQIIYIHAIKYIKTKLRLTIMTWEGHDISVYEKMYKEISKLTGEFNCKYI